MSSSAPTREAPPTPDELVRERFVPTVVYACEGSGFHTRLCLYNYFSEIYPDVKSGATARLWFFDQSGNMVAHREERLGYRGQLQFDLSALGVEFEGTAAVAMVPDTVPEFRHRGVGTGYYVFYQDDAGHADFAHEWEAMRFEPSEAHPWLCVIRPAQHPDTQIIVLNAYYGLDDRAGLARWHIRLRASDGQSLAERDMPPLPPRASCRVELREQFPDFDRLCQKHPTIAVEVWGTNIQGPFTRVRTPSGDFNIHHFC